VVHPKQPPKASDRSPTDEDATVERIGRRLRSALGPPPPGELWSGDDCAVIVSASGATLFTVDAVVAGVHFDSSLVSMADVGWKALTVAVSDVGAMGGRPTHAVMSVGAPLGTDLERLVDGVIEAATAWRCPVVGGDICAANDLFVSSAVTGLVDGPAPPVTRAGARPGDGIFVTGPLGASAGGLRLLRAGVVPEPGSPDAALCAAFRRPLARLDEGVAALEAAASAMMDVSDGLGLDLHRLASASGVGVALDDIPVAPGATLDEALGGGEDYELLIVVPDETRLIEQFAARGLRPPVRIGRCTDDPGQRDLRGVTMEPTGFRHRL
jgi:thiamine-monophosphate kinase